MIQQIGTQVGHAIETYGASRVAVLLITYQEALGFMQAAAEINDLSLINWYGCDANVQKSSLSSDPKAGDFVWDSFATYVADGDYIMPR